MLDQDMNSAVATFNAELEHLRERVRDLERELNQYPYPQLPDTWLLSQNFLKRAFTIWGHNFIVSLIVSIPFSCLWAFIAAIVANN